MARSSDNPATITADYVLDAKYDYDHYGVIYVRYSTHSQTEQSVEGQLRDNLEYAKRMRIKIIGVYIDRAVTGKVDERIEFKKMIADSAKQKFQYVIVWKLDRFARNRFVSATYKHKLKLNGVRVLSAMEQISDTPEGIILESVLEGYAEYFSADLRQKVSRGLRESWSKGQYTGGFVPYGYRVENKKVCIDEKTAPIVQYLFREYAAGRPKKEILGELRAKGIRTPNGKTIGASSFQRCLGNRRYIGEVEHDGVLYTNIFPPLIDRVIFDKVQIQLARHKHAPATVKSTVGYLLSCKAFCGKCGAVMVGDSGTSKSGKTYTYYSCANKKNKRTCRKNSEKKDFLEWYVVEQTVEYVLHPKRMDYIAERVVEIYNSEVNDDEIHALERRISQLDTELNRSVDAMINATSAATQRLLDSKINDLDIEKKDAEAELQKMQAMTKVKITEDIVKRWLLSFKDGDPLDVEFQKRVIDSLINCVYIYDDKVTIYFNLKDGKLVSYIEAAQDAADLEYWDAHPDEMKKAALSGENLSEGCSNIKYFGVPKGTVQRTVSFFFLLHRGILTASVPSNS